MKANFRNLKNVILVTLVACNRPRSLELSEFEKGIIADITVMVYPYLTHLPCFSAQKSTVDSVIGKWKKSCDRGNVPHSARSTKLRVIVRRVPAEKCRRIGRKRRGTFERIFPHLFRNNGRAVAYNLITIKDNRNATGSMMQRTATLDRRTVEKWSLEQRNRVHFVMFGWQGLSFLSARRIPPATIYRANCEIKRRWSYAVGWLFWYGTEPG